MDVLQITSQKIESIVNRLGQPIKPYISHIGRFLLIVTFLEDALRILVQWTDQLYFMTQYRHLPVVFSHLFLLYNVFSMLAGSWLALTKTQTNLSCGLLGSVIVAQSLGYGLLTHLGFMLRNLALIGGLLILLNVSNPNGKRSPLIPNLPSLTETEKGTYLSLAGRILLICLTGSLLYNGVMGSSHFSNILRVLALFIALISSVMVAIGFKARHSAVLLVAVLSIFNLVMNNWWQHHPSSPERDFMRYDFFQTLSIIGGFLLLVHAGPGDISYDSRKKDF